MIVIKKVWCELNAIFEYLTFTWLADLLII